MMTATNGYRRITVGRRRLGEGGGLPGTQPSPTPQGYVRDASALPGTTAQVVYPQQAGQATAYVAPEARLTFDAPDGTRHSVDSSGKEFDVAQPSWFEKQSIVPGVKNVVIAGGAGLLLLLAVVQARGN